MDATRLRDKLVGPDDERAVSPVIGVILMVAITVILAATIATLVMDFGQSTETPINAAVDADVGADQIQLTVTEAGSAEGFYLRGDESYGSAGSTDIGLSPSTGSSLTIAGAGASGDIAYNDGSWTATLDGGETINIVAYEGEKTKVVGTFTVPEDFDI